MLFNYDNEDVPRDTIPYRRQPIFSFELLFLRNLPLPTTIFYQWTLLRCDGKKKKLTLGLNVLQVYLEQCVNRGVM